MSMLEVIIYLELTGKKESLTLLKDGCVYHNNWLRTARARELMNNRERKDTFEENNSIIKSCDKSIARMGQEMAAA